MKVVLRHLIYYWKESTVQQNVQKQIRWFLEDKPTSVMIEVRRLSKKNTCFFFKIKKMFNKKYWYLQRFLFNDLSESFMWC